MSIVKMKRLRLIALRSEQEPLLARLQQLGCVEVSAAAEHLADPAWSALLQKAPGSAAGQVRSRAGEITSALAVLQKYAPQREGLFPVRDPVTEAELLDPAALERACAAAQAINGQAQAISRLQALENRLAAQRAGLLPWVSLDHPLSVDSTASCDLLPGTCPAAADPAALRAALEQAAPASELVEVSRDKQQLRFLLICLKEQTAAALAALKPHSFVTVRFKDVEGTAAQAAEALAARLEQTAEERRAAQDAIAALAGERPILRLAEDRLRRDLSLARAGELLLTDGTILFLEGWCPAREVKRLKKALDGADCAWELTDPAPEDDVPVALHNSALIAPVGMVSEMYSLPSYSGIDPNPLIWGWYLLFFGFMFADIAYGLIIFLVSLLVLKKFHPTGGTGRMFRLGIQLGISTFLFGLLSGGCFGNAVPQIAETFFGRSGVDLWYLEWDMFGMHWVFNPLQDPMSVLYLSVVLGAVHLVMGQCIHIYMGFRDGEALDALLDVVPWWTLFAGVAALALGGGFWLLIAGAVFLICTQGRHKEGNLIKKLFGGVTSLYDITSWLGDILSYSRLMALMLATTVIANVVNILGSLAGSVLVFIPIFLVGHVFNLGMNIIGTFVHSARLMYLEYFGKFYKDGGRAFDPLRCDTKHVEIKKAE